MVSKFLDLKNDVVSKKIFRMKRNKDLLIHFTNDMITFKEQEPIVDLTFLKPSLDPEIAAQKASVVDVLWKDLRREPNIFLENDFSMDVFSNFSIAFSDLKFSHPSFESIGGDGYAKEYIFGLYRNDLKNRLLPRRRPDFEPGEAGAKRINSKSLAMQAGSKAVAGRRRQKPIFEVISVYSEIKE